MLVPRSCLHLYCISKSLPLICLISHISLTFRTVCIECNTSFICSIQPAVSKDPKSENDEKKWLLTVVKLDDGTMGFAHTVDSIGVMWRCHPCNMVFEGKDMFQEHINTEKHKTVMARPHHKKVFFTKLVGKL